MFKANFWDLPPVHNKSKKRMQAELGRIIIKETAAGVLWSRCPVRSSSGEVHK